MDISEERVDEVCPICLEHLKTLAVTFPCFHQYVKFSLFFFMPRRGGVFVAQCAFILPASLPDFGCALIGSVQIV